MSEQRWRKSSYSHDDPEGCVALNATLDSIRDTKNDATLTVTRQAVTALISTARRKVTP